MVRQIFLKHTKTNSFWDKISNVLENLKIIYFYFLSIFIYYLLFIYKAYNLKKFICMKYFIANYVLFFFLSFYITLKVTNFFRNILVLFFVILINDISEEIKEINVHNISFYFLVILLNYFFNSLLLSVFNYAITLKDIFYNNEDRIKNLLFLFLYFIFDLLTIFILYLISTHIKDNVFQITKSSEIIIFLFVSLFFLGSYYYDEITKTKKPQFSTILKRTLFILLVNFTFGLYFNELFEYITYKQYIKKSILFLFFLVSIFISGIIIEFLIKKLEIFEKIRKHFNIFFYLFILIFYFPYMKDELQFLFSLALMIIILIVISYFKIRILEFFSDLVIFLFILSIVYGEKDNFFCIVFGIIYLFKAILQYGISRVNLVKGIATVIFNLLCFCFMFERESYQKYRKEKEKVKEKLYKEIKEKIHDNKEDKLIDHNLLMNFDENKKKQFGVFYPSSSYEFEENSRLKTIWKLLYNYINKPPELTDIEKYEKNIPKFKGCKVFYYIEEILNISNTSLNIIEIKNSLENNYNNSLIDNEIYKPKWNLEISKRYLSKYALFSLNSLDLQINNWISENYGIDFKDMYINEMPKEFNNNTVTIFVSGFLTEDKNTFAENYPDYFFKDNLKSDYFFYLWPSYGLTDENLNIFETIAQNVSIFNGFGCKFEEAYYNAIISGKILSNIIMSKNFFGDAKINLVGHSLGCRVIFYCLKYIFENDKNGNLNNIINDVIFLAGATTVEDYRIREIVEKIVNGRFINCFNKNDNSLFVSLPFSDFPIGLREIYGGSRIENYETDFPHTEYCDNLNFILNNVDYKYNGKIISFI